MKRELLVEPKRPRGRPKGVVTTISENYPKRRRTTFDANAQNFLKQFYKLALLGCSEKEMCEVVEVPYATFQCWKKMYPEINETIKKGGAAYDAKVVHSLGKRARGFRVNEEKVFYNSQIDQVRTYNTTKYFPPDPHAAQLWLSNRTRHMENPWKIRQEVESVNQNYENSAPLHMLAPVQVLINIDGTRSTATVENAAEVRVPGQIHAVPEPETV